MKTIRILILTISALLVFTMANAQSAADSKAILDKANQLYEKSEGLRTSKRNGHCERK